MPRDHTSIARAIVAAQPEPNVGTVCVSTNPWTLTLSPTFQLDMSTSRTYVVQARRRAAAAQSEECEEVEEKDVFVDWQVNKMDEHDSI